MRGPHRLAAGLGVPLGRDGCMCAVCGPSPFDPGERAAKSCFGANFADWAALADPTCPTVCLGCERLLSGRPGSDPPPVRQHSLIYDGRQTHLVDRDAWWPLISGAEPVPQGAVLSWATSRKRHHWLHAGVSGPTRWEVGTDHGTAHWTVSSELPAAVLELLAAGARKGEILSGHYRPHESTPRWLELDRWVAPHRGALILDLIVWAAPGGDEARTMPRPVAPVREEPEEMIPAADTMAADLVARVARGSQVRVRDGLRFWAANGFLVRRIRRYSHAGLSTLVSRLMAECAVGADSAQEVLRLLAELQPEQEREVAEAIRARTDLIVALAYESLRRERRREDPDLQLRIE